jgi:hypothetical protein
MTCKHDNKTFFGDASLVGHLVCDNCGYIDVPKYHEGKRVIESKLEICPLCHDTKTVSTPLQTIKLNVVNVKSGGTLTEQNLGVDK